MAATSRGKSLAGVVGDKEKAAVFSPWRIAYGVGGCGDRPSEVPVSPIRRRYHIRSVRFELEFEQSDFCSNKSKTISEVKRGQNLEADAGANFWRLRPRLRPKKVFMKKVPNND